MTNNPFFEKQNAIESFIKSLPTTKKEIGGVLMDTYPPMRIYFSDSDKTKAGVFCTPIKLEGQARNCLMKIQVLAYPDLNIQDKMATLDLSKEQYLILEPAI